MPPAGDGTAAIVVVNGISGDCSTELGPQSFWPTVELRIDGIPHPFEVGEAALALVTPGAHRVEVIANSFDCPRTFFDTTVTFAESERWVLTLRGDAGTGTVRESLEPASLSMRPNELVVVHLSEEAGVTTFIINDGSGVETARGTLSVGGLDVGAASTAGVSTVELSNDVDVWTQAAAAPVGDSPETLVLRICALRDTADGAMLACTYATQVP